MSGGRMRKRLLLAGTAAVLLGAGVLAVVWFQPQKLWIDDRVSEAAPTVAPALVPPAPAAGPDARADGPGPTTTTTTVLRPADVARGEFVSREHHTSGTVRLVDVGDGRRVVRLEGFDTSNGPSLYVYLTTNPARGPEAAFDDDHLDLGRLKGNKGDQNYDVPAGADVSRFTTVVIWCDRFDAAFGAADLRLL